MTYTGIKLDFLIKDPIYSYFELSDLEKKIVNSNLLQRLRFITQNGLAFYTYPSIRGSRFEHSIGVAHLAGRIARSIFERGDQVLLNEMLDAFVEDLYQIVKVEAQQEIHKQLSAGLKKSDLCIQLIRLLALVHDVGHLPFSHLGEEAVEPYLEKILGTADYDEFKSKKGLKLHEFLSSKIISKNPEFQGLFTGDQKVYYLILRDLYASMMELKSAKVLGKLYEIVNSDIDADRGDYLRRDGYNSGIGFGTYDIERLIDSISAEKVRLDDGREEFLIAPSDASISTVETFLLERYKLYKWLYFHHSIRYFNYCLIKSLEYLIELYDDLPEATKQKFDVNYFHYDRFVYRDGFICNEIWLWDVFYKAYIDLRNKLEELDITSTKAAQIKAALSFLRAVITREKSGFAIWKTHPEYLEFNRELKKHIQDLPCESNSKSRKRYFVCKSELINIDDQQFLNHILYCLDETHKEDFLNYFYKKGISITWGEIKNFFEANRVNYYSETTPIGRIFIVVNEFEPFSRSSISTEKEPVSKFEFILRRKNGGKRIRLTDVSRVVTALYDAWKSDIQCFLYFNLNDPDFPKLQFEERSKITSFVIQKFVKEFIDWLVSKNLLQVKK
jgi:HD superfamily phosphohydrolase